MNVFRNLFGYFLQDPVVPAPTIKFREDPIQDGTCDIVLDGHIVSTAKTVFEGFSCQMAAFYIFNVKYPSIWEDTLLFEQLIFFNLDTQKDLLKAKGSRLLAELQ